MTSRMYGTLVAFVTVVALVLAASETFADPGVARGGGFAPQRPSPPSVGRLMHHHRGFDHHRGFGGYWPTYGGVFYGPPNEYDEPVVQAPPPKTSDDIRYTCVYDIPWDYVHRCPQFTTPHE
jgi:hypothetical protein